MKTEEGLDGNLRWFTTWGDRRLAASELQTEIVGLRLLPSFHSYKWSGSSSNNGDNGVDE